MKLERDFYLCNAINLAKKLIGKTLVHDSEEGITKAVIVETEAYMGDLDEAAHSYKVKNKNGRTNIQFGFGGFAYIYLIYGMYNCFNVVANEQNIPQCVLLRALMPVDGIQLMEKRRNILGNTKKLCSGPGKLCIAMGITRELYGEDLCGERLYIEDMRDYINYASFEIEETPRINIEYAGEAKDYLWRFIMKSNEYLSKNR